MAVVVPIVNLPFRLKICHLKSMFKNFFFFKAYHELTLIASKGEKLHSSMFTVRNMRK